MEKNNIAKQDQGHSNKVQRNYVMIQVTLRTLAFISTLSAALVMVTNEQHKVVLGLSWKARYTYSAAFRFLVYANSVACAYSILSLPLLVTSTWKKPFLLFFLDLVVTMLLMSTSSAAAAIAYVGKRGEDRMGWTAVCTFIEKFCHKAGDLTRLLLHRLRRHVSDNQYISPPSKAERHRLHRRHDFCSLIILVDG